MNINLKRVGRIALLTAGLIGFMGLAKADDCTIAANADLNGDGVVSLSDLTIVTKSFGQSLDDPLYDPLADTNCDGGIDALDLAFVRDALGQTIPTGLSVALETSPSNLTIIAGQVQNIATTLDIDAGDFSEPYTVHISQVATPAGLALFPGIAGTSLTQSGDLSTLYNQEILTDIVGEFTIETTATIEETGASVSSVVEVKVVADQPLDLQVNIPGSIPGALEADAETDIVITAQLAGLDLENVTTVSVINQSSFVQSLLNDDSLDGDLTAGDGTFSGTVAVDTSGLQAGDCLAFIARAETAVSLVDSAPYQLCVSDFPADLSPLDGDTAPLVTLDNGAEAVANQILLKVSDGADVAAIAASVNATVVGSMPGLNIYQLQLVDSAATAAELNAILAQLEQQPGVVSAEANTLGEMDAGDAFKPTDPQFVAGSQPALKQIRADEAWFIARGGATIAIVDSGIDKLHPDLTGKFILDKDYIDGDMDPVDGCGHGTSVGGIAAANSNNSVGIASVSWNSKLLILRVVNNACGGLVKSNVAAAIKRAADKGATIINVSLGWYGTVSDPILCPAVTYANSKGASVVATAGNDGISTKRYPAACAGAIAVGGVTSSDARWSSSNFGSWVDLAAPSVAVRTTAARQTCPLCNATGYRSASGTSYAAPIVSGAIAVLKSRGLSNAKAEENLKKTAIPVTNLGSGRIDLFEAAFNGSFEFGDLTYWTAVGTVASFDKLGVLTPQHRDRMAYLSTGPADAQVSGNLSTAFTIQAGVSSLPLQFTYAFISEEFPEFVNSAFDDSLEIKVIGPSGDTVVATESINSSSYTLITGVPDFPGGDDTTGWTGWKTVNVSVPVTPGGGQYQIFLTDAGDSIYDTVVLVDGIQFRD